MPDDDWVWQDDYNWVIGEFIWTGYDYLGEPTPFNSDMTELFNFHDPAERAAAEAQLKATGRITPPSRSSYFGIIDLAGFPKDRYYAYQARWNRRSGSTERTRGRASCRICRWAASALPVSSRRLRSRSISSSL